MAFDSSEVSQKLLPRNVFINSVPFKHFHLARIIIDDSIDAIFEMFVMVLS